MSNLALYLITVLVWGSTWLAIEFQLGVVEPEVSALHRGFRYMPSTDGPRACASCMWSKVAALRSHLHSRGSSRDGQVTLRSGAELTKLDTEASETAVPR